jgi:NAD(P)-dependent dehydrogenase (short-subunit alcohol dehydrogenase family)
MKQFLKRLIRFLIHGIPQNNINVNVAKIVNGKTLCNRNILVTGGGSGIGFAIAKRCAEEGANVVIVGRNEKRLQEAASNISGCKILSFDVTHINQLPTLLNRAEEVMGQDIDSLVLNAGVSLHEENIKSVSIEGYEKQFKTNLEGSYFLAKAFIEKHKSNNKANLLFISSERGFQCDDVPYGLTKSAINSLTRGLSRRFYKEGVRVNAIAPGITTSNMTGVKDDDNLALDRVASGRVFLAEEVAEVALFLLSDASMCISGEVIACDAGEYISSYF